MVQSMMKNPTVHLHCIFHDDEFEDFMLCDIAVVMRGNRTMLSKILVNSSEAINADRSESE